MNTQELKDTINSLKGRLSPEDQQKFAGVLTALTAPPKPEPVEDKLWIQDPETVKKAYEKLGPEGFRKLAAATKVALDKHAEGVKIAGDAVTFGRLQCRGFMDEMLKICSSLIQKSQDEKDPQQKAAQLALSILGGEKKE